MADLSLRHIYKVYPNGTKAVSDFNMDIKDKEFIVFVGPSGCGKSTTLRMIAGLEDITAGELYIGDQLVNDVEPKDRDIAMVFQNYALYPHMTVYDNMAFGLKLRHVPKEEIHKKVLWAADVLQLTDYLDRKPRAMSGGQRQRVALGRAILRNPKVFLLDEPLSNLDAKLRTEMRAEIAKLHSELGTTFIYVTHDQVEAMTLGTRVVVMKLGVVQQIDSPQNLYAYPENKFVAGFIGTPQMNFFEAVLKRNGTDVDVKFDYCDDSLVVPFNELLKVRPKYLNGKKHVWVGLRCENITLDPEIVKKSKNKIKIKVSHFEELGNETLVYGDLNMNGDGFSESSTRVIVKTFHNSISLKRGDIVDAAFDMSKAHFFDKDTELSIVPRLPRENVFDVKIKNGVMELLGNKIKLPSAINVKDCDEAELFVPTNSMNFVGDIKATVTNIERVKEKQLIYLISDSRTFFIVDETKLKIGDEVKIGFDFKNISIVANDVKVVEPLSVFDEFPGSFTNLANSKKSLKSLKIYANTKVKEYKDKVKKTEATELGNLGFGDALKIEYKNEYKEKILNIEADRAYKAGRGGLDKEGKKALKEEFFKNKKAAKDEFENKIAKLNEKKPEEIKELDIKKADDLKKVYQEKYEFIDNFHNLFDTNLDAGFKNFILNNKHEKQEKDHIDNFYIDIAGMYVKSTDEISKKIVQALGVGLFRSNFRFYLSHYSYTFSKDNGIDTEITNILDYGKEKFAICMIYNKPVYVSIKNNEVKIGEKVKLEYNLNDIQIYEDKFDIRLY